MSIPDPLEGAAQPPCPACSTVLRDDPRGFYCATCNAIWRELQTERGGLQLLAPDLDQSCGGASPKGER